MSKIPESKFRFASATHDDTIYVFGGQSAFEVTGDCTDSNPCFPVTDHVWAMNEVTHTPYILLTYSVLLCTHTAKATKMKWKVLASNHT